MATGSNPQAHTDAPQLLRAVRSFRAQSGAFCAGYAALLDQAAYAVTVRALILQNPGQSAVVAGVIVGLVAFFAAGLSTDWVSIGLSGLVGGAWGIGFRWSLSRVPPAN